MFMIFLLFRWAGNGDCCPVLVYGVAGRLLPALSTHPSVFLGICGTGDCFRMKLLARII
jgi:hypothetical protein